MTFREAHDSLRGAQKSGKGAPAYSRWINRPIGRVFAAAAYRLGLTPNQVTAISAACTFMAVALIALLEPSGVMGLGAAGLLVAGYALDSADGQLARLTKMGRPSGEWLDHVVDMAKVCLLNGAVAVSWSQWGVPGFSDVGVWALGIPIFFLTVSVLDFFGWLLADLLTLVAQASQKTSGATVSAAGAPATAPSAAPALRSVLRLPGDYGLLAVTFVWFAAPLFFVSFTALLVANAAILAAALPVWFGQVRESEVPR